MAYKVSSAFYLGREDERHITDFLVADTLYFILELKNNHNKSQVTEVIRKFKDEIVFKTNISLEELKSIVDETFTSIENVENFSLALVLFIKDASYLITRGDGEISLYRNETYSPIIFGDRDASGYVAQNDMFVMSSKSFTNIIDKTKFENALMLADPKTIVSEITPDLKEKEDVGAIALLVHLGEEIEEEPYVEEETKEEVKDDIKVEAPSLYSKLRDKYHFYQQGTSHTKKITFGVLAIIALVLIWSVGLGSYRHLEKENQDKLIAFSTKVDATINEASQIVLVNPQKVTDMILLLKTEYGDLKKSINNDKNTQLIAISQKIDAAEKSLFKKEDKIFEEFYDFNLIKKGINPEYMGMDQGAAVFLNRTAGEVYRLALDKKSVETVSDPEIKKATFLSSYNGTLFIYSPDEGIVKIEKDKKPEVIIKKDDEWGSIVDMVVFNGNIYVLDKGKSDVYKYLVAENGYSDKKTYFKEAASGLSEATHLYIDANLYILTSNNIYKYLSGMLDAFALNISEKAGNFYELNVDKNNENLYLLTKETGKLFILNKKGEYQKEISSSVFAKADSFFVDEKISLIFVQSGDKIYKIILN